MNSKIVTWGAVAFAAFAVSVYLKSKGKGIGPLTGEQQRMQGVDDLFTVSRTQERAIEKATMPDTYDYSQYGLYRRAY